MTTHKHEWTKAEVLEMMRYGKLILILGCKPYVGGGYLIRYRLMRRRGNFFQSVGPVKTMKQNFLNAPARGDMMFCDHGTREWTRLRFPPEAIT